MRGGCEWGHSKNTIPIPHIHSRLPAGQGTAKPLILWLKTPNCRSTLKVGNAEAAFRLIIGFVDQLQIYPKETSNSQYPCIYIYILYIQTFTFDQAPSQEQEQLRRKVNILAKAGRCP